MKSNQLINRSLIAICILTLSAISARASCDDDPKTEFKDKWYPFETSDVYHQYKFWTIPVDASERKSINYYKTAQRFNEIPPKGEPDFICAYDGPGNKYFNTDRNEGHHYTCKHKNGKIFWNTPWPMFVVDKNNETVYIQTYTDPRDGLGSYSQYKSICKEKRKYRTLVFFMRPCEYKNGYATNCGELIDHLAIVRTETIIEPISKKSFDGF